MAGEAGLAQGLLAGWQVGQQYNNGKADREYRQQQAERDQANSDRQYGLAQAQFKSQDDRDQRNFQYQQERDKTRDEQFQQQRADNRAERQASRSLQGAALNLRQQELSFQRNQQLRTQRLQEEQPIVSAFYESVKSGTPDYKLLDRISGDNPLNPKRFVGEEAITTARNIQTVVPQVLSGQVSLEDPQAVGVLNSVLKPYIQRNIGEKDPQTGKEITSKELAHIGISEDGQSVIPTLRVHYKDGSSAIKPMTEGGSAHPGDDSVAQIPIAGLQQELASYAKMTNVLSNPTFMAGIQPYLNGGNKQGVRDEEEYRKAVLDVQGDAAKAKASLNKDGLMAPEEVKAAEDRIDQSASARMQQVDNLFGRGRHGQGDAATRQESQDDSALMAAFAEQYKQQFGEDPDFSNKQDAQAYNSWKQVMTVPPTTAPRAAGPSPQKLQEDSRTAQYLREMRQQAQSNKQQQ